MIAGRRAGLLAATLLLTAGAAEAAPKIAIGGVETVVLLPSGVRLPARVDTGATTSSLGAEEIRREGEAITFRLAKTYGGLRLRLPVIAWRRYKTSTGTTLRPVVALDICLGTVRIRAEVNLNDRSQMDLPFLVGRNILKDRFIVDVDRTFAAAPSCPETRP